MIDSIKFQYATDPELTTFFVVSVISSVALLIVEMFILYDCGALLVILTPDLIIEQPSNQPFKFPIVFCIFNSKVPFVF